MRIGFFVVVSLLLLLLACGTTAQYPVVTSLTGDQEATPYNFFFKCPKGNSLGLGNDPHLILVRYYLSNPFFELFV